MTKAFRALLMEGLRKFARGGYVSENELQDWMMRLHAALEREVPTDKESRETLTRILEAVYARNVQTGIEERIPKVKRWTLDRVQPHMRAELDKRIFAGVDLIKLNRKAAVEKTLQRFAGWISSVPPAGSTETNLRSVARDITKPVARLKFEARRVAIDQGHKLISAIDHVIAMQEGAIAAIWHDRGEHDKGYDARPEHLRRSGKLFLVRDSWANAEGLVKRAAGVKFTDEFEQPAELPYCSCFYEYIVSPHRLPRELLTGRGRAYVTGKPIEEVRADAVPTPAQIIAGNYPMEHIRLHGFDVTIETGAGELRTGTGSDGKPWAVVMPAPYGYIRRTIGADDEQIDCYIGPNADAGRVYVIDQVDADTRKFDEQKVMLGFNSRTLAVQTYVHGFSDGRGHARIGAVVELDVDTFKAKLREGRTLISAAV